MPRSRVESLAARVRWLDRYRRLIAITVAGVTSPYLIGQLGHELGGEWPKFDATLLSLMLGVIVWVIGEVALAYLAAMWETEQFRLALDRGLPRATIRRTGRWHQLL
jgi:hypothetical protein